MTQQDGYQLTAVLGELRSHRSEARYIIRLGAVANAVLSISRARSRGARLSSLRDNIQLLALMASYAVEASRILNEPEAGIAWQLAAASSLSTGLRPDELAAFKSLTSKPSFFMSACAEVRDQHSFHVDAKPAMNWIKDRTRENAVVLQTVEDNRFTSCLFDASAQMVRAAFPVKTDYEAFTREMARFATLMPRFVEAVIKGFGLELNVTIAERSLPSAPPFRLRIRHPRGEPPLPDAVEIRPSGATWAPFYVGLPSNSPAAKGAELRFGANVKQAEQLVGHEPSETYEGWSIHVSTEPATPDGAAHFLFCRELPELLIFGQLGGVQHRSVLSHDWGPKNVSAPPSLPNL